MAYLTPHEKSEIVRDLLKEYIKTALEGTGERINEEEIKCMENTIAFEECHVVSDANENTEFETNRDSISNGAEVPPYINDFPVYMCWYSSDGKLYFRVWAYWGDVEFK